MSSVVQAPAQPAASPRSASTLVLVLLTAALIGGNYAALKEALAFSSPIMLTAIRAFIGGLALLAFALVRGERLPRNRHTLLGIFVVSLCITTLSSTFLAFGVARVTSGMAALLSATMPVFAAVLALVVLAESPRGRGWFGMALGVIGTFVLASPALTGDTNPVGVLCLLLATFTWACGTVVLKRWDFAGTGPITLVAVQLLMSSAVVAVLGLAVEGFGDVHAGWGLVVPLGYAAIPGMAMSFALLTTVVKRAPAVQAASTAYLIPVCGLLVGWLIQHETLLAAQLVGGVLAVAGVSILSLPGAIGARRTRANTNASTSTS